MTKRAVTFAGAPAGGAESLAVSAGGLVFTSAVTAFRPHAGDPRAEVGAVLDTLTNVLDAAGSGIERTAKFKAFLGDTAHAVDVETVGHARMSDAVSVSVGATLPHPKRIAVEITAGADESPVLLAGLGPAAARLGALVFTAGCNALADGRLRGACDLGAQGRHALDTLCAALDHAGAAPAGLLKVNNTTACWHDYRLYNEAYNAVLQGSNAARCSVSGPLRDPLALIEVEGVASLLDERRFVDSTRSGVGRANFVRRSDTAYLSDLGPCKGPHSHGARAGNVVFIAGECAYDADDVLVGPGDIAAQTARTLENVRLSLEALGATLDDVVKTSVTLSDLRLGPAFEQAYRRVFSFPYPARSVVATPLGQYGILVEIEAIAIVGASRQALAVAAGDAV